MSCPPGGKILQCCPLNRPAFSKVNESIMLLPIRTSVRSSRTPYANYALIAVNVVVFLLSYWPDERARDILRPWAEQFVFTPAHPFLWQFITYAFLHSGYLHIFGNMFFLYIFGNNVNDKLGHFGSHSFLPGGCGVQRGGICAQYSSFLTKTAIFCIRCTFYLFRVKNRCKCIESCYFTEFCQI